MKKKIFFIKINDLFNFANRLTGDHKNVSPGNEKSDETINKDTKSTLNAKKTTSNSEYWLFQIQSTILM